MFRKIIELNENYKENNHEKTMEALNKLISGNTMKEAYPIILRLFNDKEKVMKEINKTYFEDVIYNYRQKPNKELLINRIATVLLTSLFEGKYTIKYQQDLVMILIDLLTREEFADVEKEAFTVYEEVLLETMSWSKEQSYLIKEEVISETVSYYKEKALDSLYETELNDIIDKIKSKAEAV